MPKNDNFNALYRRITNQPYIFMQPIDDTPEGHQLIANILEHRITGLIHGSIKPSTYEKLEDQFKCMCNYLDHWVWPRTANRNLFSSGIKAEVKQARYCPLPKKKDKGTGKSWGDVSAIWEPFLAALAADPAEQVSIAPRRRLEVFRSMPVEMKWLNTERADLPRIKHHTPKCNFHDLPNSEATWRELIVGGVDGGQWEMTIKDHIASKRFSRN